MASPSWLESSLQRSAILGLEVLERASRRSVDWTCTGSSQTPVTINEGTHIPVKRRHAERDDVFETIAGLMVQTTHQCKRFYESGCCTEPTDTERMHVSRFHSRPAVGMKTPVKASHSKVTQSETDRTMNQQVHDTPDPESAADEDFVVVVSPGTYAVTASMPELHQQTQLVSVNAGESVSVTFNL